MYVKGAKVDGDSKNSIDQGSSVIKTVVHRGTNTEFETETVTKRIETNMKFHLRHKSFFYPTSEERFKQTSLVLNPDTFTFEEKTLNSNYTKIEGLFYLKIA